MNESMQIGFADPSFQPKPCAIKIFGVGGAGVNAIGQMVKSHFQGVDFCAVNTDYSALQGCAVKERVLLGQKTRRGLGAGGDPEVGRAAAQDEEAALRKLCEGLEIVFIVAGLGGGTGTGAGPVLARAAKAAGALVIAVVTLPFGFEGDRCQRQAQLGLQYLRAEADCVICIPNHRALKLVDEKTPLTEAFEVMNRLLDEGVRGICRLLTQPALIKLDIADLRAASQGKHAESVLASIEVAGENRVREAVEKLSQHALLDEGRALSEADALLVSVVGGPDLSIGEVNRLLEQINRLAENSRVSMGALVDPKLAGKLSVTVIASRFGGVTMEAAPAAPAAAAPAPAAPAPAPDTDTNFHRRPMPRPASRFVAPPPAMSPDQVASMFNRQMPTRRARKKSAAAQGQLPLEIVSKGRFEKSEPTIHQGEDLDVPTYIRRGIVLN